MKLLMELFSKNSSTGEAELCQTDPNTTGLGDLRRFRAAVSLPSCSGFFFCFWTALRRSIIRIKHFEQQSFSKKQGNKHFRFSDTNAMSGFTKLAPVGFPNVGHFQANKALLRFHDITQTAIDYKTCQESEPGTAVQASPFVTPNRPTWGRLGASIQTGHNM
jgi:hypothetical protein